MKNAPVTSSKGPRGLSFDVLSLGRWDTKIGQAFTLIELLVVISIIGLLAGLAVPVVNNFKPNVVDAANRQLLDDISRARQYAIAQRTTIYMVFVPTNFWTDPAYNVGWTQEDLDKATRLFDKQMIAYNFVALRRPGDQPGQGRATYLSSWRTLPEGTFIAPQKFTLRAPAANPSEVLTISTNDPGSSSRYVAMRIYALPRTNGIPFPREETVASTYVTLPYIAFNYLGQLVMAPTDLDKVYDTQGRQDGKLLIPITKGSISFVRTNGVGDAKLPTIQETPVGNSTNAFNVVSIDLVTGRAHLRRPVVQ